MHLPVGPRASLVLVATVFCLAPASLSAQTAPSAEGPEAATAQPASAQSFLPFIDSALADGRLQGAQDLIARARALDDGAEIRLREAELLLASGAVAQALAGFASLENDPLVGARAMVGKAIAELREGRDTHARAALDMALATDPALVRGWIIRGVLADRKRDWTASDASYGRAIALAPGSAIAFNNRGYARLLQGRHAEAEADLARALELDNSLAAATTNLRLARAMQGRYADAFLGSTRDALARDLNTVGFGAMSRGDYALAESYFARAMEINGQFDHTAAANLAYLETIAPRKSRTQDPGK